MEAEASFINKAIYDMVAQNLYVWWSVSRHVG